jgi:hypothetical protein
MSTTPRDPRSLGELVSSLFQDMRLLIKQELELAKREVKENVSSLSNSIVTIAIAAGLLILGAVALTATLILSLALFIPAWASALIVGTLLVLLGAVTLFAALRKLRLISLIPKRTLKTLKRSTEVIKEPLT